MPGAVTKTDHAYAWIRGRILSADLAPGDALDPESLSTALNVSTTPLREAMRRLEAEGLVVNRVHRDTVVAPISDRTLEESFAVRLQLEPLAASLAAQHATEIELTDLATFIDTPPTDRGAMSLLRYNGMIHRLIYRAGHNEVLSGILDQLSDRVDRYRAIAMRGTQEQPPVIDSDDVHSRILVALANRDAVSAQRLMRDHVVAGFERMQEASQDLKACEPRSSTD